MKNKIFTITILTVSFFLVGNAYAVSQGTSQKAGNSTTVQVQTETQVTNQGAVKGQNNEQVQENLNEDSGIRVQQQTQERLQDETGELSQNKTQAQNQGENQQIQNNEQNGNVTQRRSQVANAVQEMLQVAERNGGIGEQIRVIAQNQNQNQEKIETSLQKVQKRNFLTRFFAGPDYSEINKAQEFLRQNSQQIEQLNQIKEQIINSEDQQQLFEQIQSLKQVNSEIENSLNEQKKGFSLFGWLFKIISK